MMWDTWKMQPGDLTVHALKDLLAFSTLPLPLSRFLPGLAELALIQQPELNVCSWLVARLLACHSAG